MAEIKDRPPSSALDDLKPDLSFKPGARKIRLSISPQNHDPLFKAHEKPAIGPLIEEVTRGIRSDEIKPNTEQTPNKQRTNAEQMASTNVNSELTSNLTTVHSEQTSNKLRTSDNKLENTEQIPNEHLSNTEQTESKHRTNSEQIANKGQTNAEQTPNQHQTKSRTEHRTNYENIHVSEKRFHSLVGLRRNIILFIYESCKSARAKTTNPIALANLALSCSTGKDTAEVTIRRLEKEGFVHKSESKIGKGGWTIYELPEPLYQEILHLESTGRLQSNTEQTTNKYRTEHRTNSPSSCSDLHMHKTNYTEAPATPDKKELPLEWKEIDYSCLASIGFKTCHINQIFESGKCPPEMVQESIDAMVYDLKAGYQGHRSPLLVFLKLLRNGKEYTAIMPGFETEELKYERLRVEAIKRRNEELTRLRVEATSLENAPAETVKDSQFQTWLSGLTAEQRRELAPHAKVDGGDMQRGLLRAHWENNVLAPKKEQQEAEETDQDGNSREQIREMIDASLKGRTL